MVDCGDYRLRKGRINFWPQTLYRSDGAAVINLVLYWARGHREPWYLATSLSDPRQAVRMYRKRMQPEQSVSFYAAFKDGKQRFGLNRSTVTTTDRLQRLLVGLLLACCLLILAGVRASPSFRRQVCSRGKLGILNLGYEYYRRPLPTRRTSSSPFTVTGYGELVRRFVAQPEVPSVCQRRRAQPATLGRSDRKISGGTRSLRGTHSKIDHWLPYSAPGGRRASTH